MTILELDHPLPNASSRYDDLSLEAALSLRSMCFVVNGLSRHPCAAQACARADPVSRSTVAALPKAREDGPSTSSRRSSASTRSPAKRGAPRTRPPPPPGQGPGRCPRGDSAFGSARAVRRTGALDDSPCDPNEHLVDTSI